MALNVITRRVHYWVSFLFALPVLVILATGVLLQVKKQSDFVQPPEQRGTGTVPAIDLEQILTAAQASPELGVKDWSDIERLDLRPRKGLAKVHLANGWEAQIDLGDGKLLQVAYRRSDLIESLHDGSFFAGNWTKLGLFLPAGVALLGLWASGLWMFGVTWAAKRRRASRAAQRPLVSGPGVIAATTRVREPQT